MRTSLKTTTAMLAALSLALPHTLAAQDASRAAVQDCAEDVANCDPAAVAEGLAQDLGASDRQSQASQAAPDAAAAQAEAEEAAKVQAAEEAAAAQAEQQAAAQAEAEAAAAAQAEQEAAAAQAEAQAAAQAEAEAAAAEQAQAEVEAQKQAEAEAAAAAQAQAEEQARQQAEAEAAAAAQKAEASDRQQAASRAQAETDQQAAEAAAQQATQAQPVEESTDVSQSADTGVTEAEDQARNAANAEKKERKAAKQAEKAQRQAEKASRQAEREAEKAARQAERQAAQAEAQSAAALAAAQNEDTQAGEVIEETVTEQTSRRSDEDFSGTIQAEAGAAPQASPKSDGLSKLEKALLLGAGALAVGTLIRGNREVVSAAPDRVVVSSSDGNYQVLKDDDALLRQPGNQVQTRSFDDGSTRSVVTRDDGSQVVTIRDSELRVVRRSLIRPDGTEVLLIDDTANVEPVDVSTLPAPADTYRASNDDALRAALEREGAFDRRFTLSQVRQIDQVRKLAPAIEVASIQFETGSSAIRPEEAQKLADLGLTISNAIEENPNEIFLVEGHTDAVGSAATNLILSDRRAESLALALTEYFDVPPENLVVQGYGESDLVINTDSAEAANRRAELRRITNLLQVASLN